MNELSGLICALGVTETNLHCQDANQNRMMTMQGPYFFEHNRRSMAPALSSMQGPYFFEHNRKLKANKIILRD